MDATRLICDICGLRLWQEPREGDTCPECGGPVRRMARLESLVDRWFAPPEQMASVMHRRHLQLIELMWTAENRGREMYEVLRPKGVSYDKFVDRVTVVVCRGLAEGWIVADIPPAPMTDDSAYAIRFVEAERFAAEVDAAFASQPVRKRGRGRSDRENGRA